MTTATLRTRLETVRDYILWHLDQTLSRMDMSNPQFERVSKKRSLIQQQFNKDLPAVRNKSADWIRHPVSKTVYGNH